jgi:hypothetical protein
MVWPDDFVAPGTGGEIRKAMCDHNPGRNATGYGVELIRKDGVGLEVTVSACRYCPENGGEPFYYSLVTDATGRKKERMALQEAEAQAELLLDLMSNDLSHMNRLSIRYLELALGTACLSPSERELIMTALWSLMNSSRMIDNVRRVQERGRFGFS